MGLVRQTWTLVSKNLTILVRHPLTIVVIGFLLPIALSIFYGYSQNLLRPPVTYGSGDPHPIRSLSEALERSNDRHRVVFVNNGFEDGPIESVIDSVASDAESVNGIEVLRRDSESALNVDCEPGLRGVTDCFGAVVFHSSPSEGDSGYWDYTLFLDGAVSGINIHVDRNNNDMDLYLLPFQRAIEAAIAVVAVSNSSDNGDSTSGPQPAELPGTVDRYPFTSVTPEELQRDIREAYQGSLINFLAVTYLATVCFVTYHLTGFIASERESGMIQLIDAMMPTKRRWLVQASRIISYHFSFDLVYIFGWVVSALVVRGRVFTNTSVAIVLFYNIVAGFAMCSFAILISSVFQRAQLSGVTALLATVLLGILAQALTNPGTGPVIVLSLLFAPCNYVFFIINIARFERQRSAADMLVVAPESSFDVTGIVLWAFIIIQIFAYPLLGAIIESFLFGTNTKGRTVLSESSNVDSSDVAVRLDGFSKHFSPSIFRRIFSFISKPRDTVRAVDGLTLEARRGQILALLGANGSGKSTTLDAVAGTNRLTSGSITIDGRGGLGIAPQKNVLWDELTVMEHIKIFNRLKSPGNVASKEELRDLIRSVDLDMKWKSMSKTLSGGQKRKLQLGMMLTGGSAVCCVDEVSSGLDPLSRRKIWDILLAERGRRTMILTTHFLDEADILADHIAVLSKGTLRASGSSVELKDDLGAGYRIHIPKENGIRDMPDVPGVQKKVSFDVITYTSPSSALAAQVIRALEAQGIGGYNFSGPTIEDVFLHLAEEVRGDLEKSPADSVSDMGEKKAAADSEGDKSQGIELMDGKRIGYFRQIWVLYRKRWVVFKTNWLPYVAAFLIPIFAAALTTLFIQGEEPGTCGPPDTNFGDDAQSLNPASTSLNLVIGPSNRFNTQSALAVLGPVFLGAQDGDGGGSGESGDGGSDGGNIDELVSQLFGQNTSFVDDFDSFTESVINRRAEIRPAGLWLGDDDVPPTLAYLGNSGGMFNSLLGQNLLNMLLSNVTVSASYAPLEIPWDDQNTQSLQLLVYFALALCVYPGFFALYPSLERRRQVRALQYSNGVRPVPLWVAHLIFDYSIVLISSAVVLVLWAGLSDIWYELAYLYPVFILYGLASILLAYVVSLFSATQLAAYANTAIAQALIFVVYIIAYFFTFTGAPIERLDDALLMVHWIVSIFAPIGSVTRSLFMTLNLFSTACDGDEIASNPGGLLQYGGPILYLALQSIILFGLLLWLDSGSPGSSIVGLFRRKRGGQRGEASEPENSDQEIANELVRVTSTRRDEDGLRVQHLTKSFGKNTAVDNVSFGIPRGEVFALLGPNGAGKSTLISMVRGDVKPSHNGGDIFVEDKSVISDLAAARANLGVCPQHDALDQMTVREHLDFYARMRGIPEVDVNVNAVLTAVGLQAFANRMANALSGGNKRKLSLGIALMGNPTVILLDEPSSGLDAAAKRIMWKTLAATVPGRSLLLTTHSMEEASALAGRAGILAKRMLALGTTDSLRRRFGDALHVHLISKSAPHTSPEETEYVRAWVASTFPSAEFDKTYHGQMRFAVSAKEVSEAFASRNGGGDRGAGDSQPITEQDKEVSDSAVGKLVVMLEENKDNLQVLHFSVSPTTLDQVFLTIVGRHNVQEEGYNKPDEKKWKSWTRKLCCLPPSSS